MGWKMMADKSISVADDRLIYCMRPPRSLSTSTAIHSFSAQIHCSLHGFVSNIIIMGLRLRESLFCGHILIILHGLFVSGLVYIGFDCVCICESGYNGFLVDSFVHKCAQYN